MMLEQKSINLYQDISLLSNGIDVSNYNIEFKVAIITILSLGYFDRSVNAFRLPNISQCIDGYNKVLNNDRFYVDVMESKSIRFYSPIPIIY